MRLSDLVPEWPGNGETLDVLEQRNGMETPAWLVGGVSEGSVPEVGAVNMECSDECPDVVGRERKGGPAASPRNMQNGGRRRRAAAELETFGEWGLWGIQ